MSKLRDFVAGRGGLASRHHVWRQPRFLGSGRGRQKRRQRPRRARQWPTLSEVAGWTIANGLAHETTGAFVSDQVRGLFSPPDSSAPPPVPDNLCLVENVTEFLRSESTARGFLWAPSASVITDWCRPASPFNIQGLALVRLWPEGSGGEYRVAVEKTALVRLVEIQRRQCQAQQPAQQPAAAPPPRPSEAEQEQARAALASARRTPGQILSMENAKYFEGLRKAEAEVAAQAAQAAEANGK